MSVIRRDTWSAGVSRSSKFRFVDTNGGSWSKTLNKGLPSGCLYLGRFRHNPIRNDYYRCVMCIPGDVRFIKVARDQMRDNAERMIGEQMQVASDFFSNIDRYIGLICSGCMQSAGGKYW